MNSHSDKGARPQQIIAASLIAAILATLMVLSTRYEGVATADVTLHDGGVWVTKNSDALVGRLNYAAGAIDGSVIGPSTETEIYQNGDSVAVQDFSTSSLQLLDTATVAFTPQVIELPHDAAISMGATAVSILDPKNGDWWVLPTDQLATLPATEPSLNVGERGHGLLAYDGRAVGVDVENGVFYEAQAHDPSSFEKPKTEELARTVGAGARTQLSVAGKNSVLFSQDSDTGEVQIFWGKNDPIDLAEHIDADEVALIQPPSAAGSEVVIATASHLVRVAADGAVHLISAPRAGVPAAPQQVAGCIYGAWASDISHLTQICGDSQVDQEIPGSNPSAELKFRVNRDLVVLNDLDHGQTWQFDGVLVMIDQWDDARPESDGKGESEPNPVNLPDNAPIDRTLENRDPIAEDDSFGVRAGSTAILPVLLNDSDPDGDVLTARPLQDLPPEFGTVEVVNNGRTLQAKISEQAQGRAAISYEASDGRGGTSTASLMLEVVPESTNNSPVQQQEPRLTVTAGGSIKAYVLGEVIDPDGDPVYLCGATGDDGIRVQADPSGYIELTSTNTATGQRTVKIGLSDGRSECQYSGTVHVLVQPAGGAAPVPIYDHVTAHTGVTQTIYPLENDISPSGRPLQLSFVSEAAGLDVEPFLSGGKIEVTGDEAGTHYLEYTALDESGASAIGLIRVDVVDHSPGAPIATADFALLRPTESVLIDPTANDYDPQGAVLSVKDVQAPPELSVAVIDHHLLRISSPSGLEQPTRFTYTVTNGTGEAQGEVTVVPLAGEEQVLGPQTVHDHARVRAGDYVTVPVLANDKHPGGLALSLDPTLTDVTDGGGTMFATGQVVRFLAPAEPGIATATYAVSDEKGHTASGQVSITVVEASDENQPPAPATIRGRVTAGGRVQLPVELTGIDPDGDSVIFLGIADSPQLGRIVESGPDYLVYEAFEGSNGTDEFSYTVRDRLGLESTAIIQVGVLARSDQNRPPVTIPDYLVVRPGRTVQIDPLLNDSDPDGDAISYADPAISSGEVPARVQGAMVQIDVPDTEGSYVVQYYITDNMSPPVPGTIRLEVREDAPLHRPIATDDVVGVADIIGLTEVTVPVLDNDYDPDGPHEDLRVSLPDLQQFATVEGDQIVVPVGDQRTIVMYQITDADDLSSYAFIDVPGLLDSGPALRTDVSPITVPSGEVIDIPVNDYIHNARATSVMVVADAPVSASNSAGLEAVVNDATLRYQSAPGYSGPASITATFADAPAGTGPSTVITIPITVTSGQQEAPSIRGTVVNVPIGGEVTAMDLNALITHSSDQSFSFSLQQTPPGITADISGSELSMSLSTDTALGQSFPLVVSASNGVNSSEGTVTAVAVGTNAPLMVAVDDSLGELSPGSTGRIDVLANDTNPFPDRPLRLISATLSSGSASVSVDGSEVLITPDVGYSGQIEVVYTAVDATGETSRRATARVKATVPSPPDQMVAPSIHSIGDGHVVLQLTPPNSRGIRVDGYVISYDSGPTMCKATLCRIDGLTNGQDYTFTVVATNDYGQSPPSAPSAVARPDRLPTAPNAPTVTPGTGAVSIQWSAPNGSTSTLEYDVEISPAARGVSQRRTLATAMDWTSLHNGGAYRARVRAINGSGQSGPWSNWSNEAVPFDVPAQPEPPQVSLQEGDAQGSAQVSWSTPSANGSELTGLELHVYRNGSHVDTKPFEPGTTSATIATDHQVPYQFALIASNSAGNSPRSALSNSVTSLGPIGVPTGVTGKGTGISQQIQITHSGVAAPGRNITYQHRVRTAGGSEVTLTANPNAPGFFTVGADNGTPLRASVRACDGAACGEWSADSAPFEPYKLQILPAPKLSVTATTHDVTFTWNSDDIEEKVHSTRSRLKVDNHDWSAWKTVPTGRGVVVQWAHPGSCVTIQLQARDDDGNWGSQIEISVATHPSGTKPPFPAPKSCG